MAKEVILHKGEKEEIVIRTSIEELNKFIEDNQGKDLSIEVGKETILLSNIICACHVNEMDESTAKEYIKKVKLPKTEYPCYGNRYTDKDGNYHNLVIHECALSSFKCVVDILGQPEYVIIYKRDKDKSVIEQYAKIAIEYEKSILNINHSIDVSTDNNNHS